MLYSQSFVVNINYGNVAKNETRKVTIKFIPSLINK
jgi:hypothetical protein